MSPKLLLHNQKEYQRVPSSYYSFGSQYYESYVFLVCNQSVGMWRTMSATHVGWIRQWN